MIVFIHGFLGSDKDWDFYKSDFKNSYFHNLPGHSNCNDQLQNYDLENFARHLNKKILQMGIQKPILWGYSLGGRIALKYSELFEVKGLILESSRFSKLSPIDSKQRELQDLKWSEKITNLNWDDFLKEWYSQNLFKDFKNSPYFENYLKLRSGDKDLLKQILIESSPSRNPLPELNQISKPTLALVGSKDSNYYNLWFPQIDKFKNVDIKIIRDCGHVLHLENPNETLKISIKWLSERNWL